MGEARIKSSPGIGEEGPDGDTGHSLQLAQLAAIVEFSDDAIYSESLTGHILSWNNGAARLFGHAPDEAIGKPITLIIPPEHRAEELDLLARVSRGERIENFETVRVHKDGSRLDLAMIIAPIRDRSGAILGASKIARNIGAQRRAERELAQLAAIIESSHDAIVSKSLDGQIQSWNSGAAHIFGYQPEEVIGRSIMMIIPAELQGEERQILDKIRHGERVDHFDTIRLTKDGRRIPISLSVSPVRDLSGRIIGASKIARDISDRKAAEQALQEKTAALREADRRKDEFIALLAHELRNPLAPIRYALATTKKPNRTPEQQQRAEEIIERQVVHMSHLLDDLLDVSRVSRGTFTLKKAVTELTVVIGTAIETARPLLDSKCHVLSVDLPRQAVRLVADSVRLAQVFSNILINAAKYTDPGGQITLQAAQIETDVVVRVRDNGIGISTAMMPRMFGIFAQDEAVAGRSEGGLGIGLSLVRGIVQLHGGTIEAHSDGPGHGSEFIVRIPLGLPSDGTAPALVASDPAAGGTRLKVLVVDDNRDAADSCSTLLALAGHEVRTTYTGQQALEAAAAWNPDIVLADIGLPDIDGYSLARKLRADADDRRTVLVAVTGWGQEHDRQRAFDAGFDHHLTKPIAPERVESLLRSIGAVEDA